MQEARKPANEASRLSALRAYDILDTLPEKAYDDIVYIASTICGTPMALVSFVDSDRQWFKSRRGINAAETPRSVAFCAHAILEPDQLLVVEDTSLDERFADNPLVVDQPQIRFYAGAPLITSEGEALGTLCVLDVQPRELSTTQADMLRALSRQIIAQLELRSSVAKLRQRNTQLQRSQQELASLCQLLEGQHDIMERDLHRAEVIQRSLLPHNAPELDNCYVQTLYRPGHTIGGDLYDVVRIDDQHIALIIADAAGHGVSAAMLSVLFKHHLNRAMQANARNPAAVLADVNARILRDPPAPGAFVTSIYCLLDTASNTMVIASAGHAPAIHTRADGSFKSLGHTGPALGLTQAAEYQQHDHHFREGDRLLMFTDGLLDTVADTPPGAPDIATALNDIGHDPEVLERLLTRITDGCEHSDRDDVTLVLFNFSAGVNRFNDTGSSISLQATTDATVPRIRFAQQEGTTFFFFEGRITWMYGQPLFDHVCAVIEQKCNVVLDFTDCTHLDSTLLGTLHELLLRAGETGVSLCLQRVSPALLAAFDELSMARLSGQVVTQAQSAPAARQTLQLAEVSPSRQRDRLLRAHEVLAELSDENRAELAGLIDTLREEQLPRHRG